MDHLNYDTTYRSAITSLTSILPDVTGHSGLSRNAKTEVWKRLEVDHWRLSRLLLKISGTMNSLAPIDNLPDEILVEIIRTTCLSTLKVVDLLSMAAVCSRWRQLALRDRRLWNLLDVAQLNGQLAELFLDRSGNRPLRIICENPYPRGTTRHRHVNVSWIGDFCTRHAARIGSIRLDLKLCRAANLEGAERLVELVLHSTGKRSRSSSTGFAPTECSLHGGHLVSLRSLELRNVIFTHLETMTTLTSLVIYEYFPSLVGLVGALEHLSLLETFELSAPRPVDILMGRSNQGMSNAAALARLPQPVSLPHLRRMVISGPVDNTMLLLWCIEVPSTIDLLSVTAHPSWPMGDHLAFVAGHLFGKQCLPTSTFADLEDLSIESVGHDDPADLQEIRIRYESRGQSLTKSAFYSIQTRPCPHSDADLHKIAIHAIRTQHQGVSARKLRIYSPMESGGNSLAEDVAGLLRGLGRVASVELTGQHVAWLHRFMGPSVSFPDLRTLSLTTECDDENPMGVSIPSLISTLARGGSLESLSMGFNGKVDSEAQAWDTLASLRYTCEHIREVVCTGIHFSVPGPRSGGVAPPSTHELACSNLAWEFKRKVTIYFSGRGFFQVPRVVE